MIIPGVTSRGTTAALLRAHTRNDNRFVTCRPHSVPWCTPAVGELRTGVVFDLDIVTDGAYVCWTPTASFESNADWEAFGGPHISDYVSRKLRAEL